MALTEWKDLLQRLERDPESDVLAAMLTDALIEERDMTFSESCGYVERARKTARDALDIAHVANVIRAAGPLYTFLIERVRRALGQPSGAAFVLFLVSGDDPPRIGVGVEQLAHDDPGPGLYVVLPCSWARRELSRSILPLTWPKSPTRVAARWRGKPPQFRIVGQKRPF